jgi:hypothetical protein
MPLLASATIQVDFRIEEGQFMSTTETAPPAKPMRLTRPGGLIDKYFYFFMSLLIAVTVVYGFSHTVKGNLFQPDLPRPTILWFHAAIFSGWVVFFIFQSALIRTRNVGLHRITGWFGAALAAAIPMVGIPTAIHMTRFHVYQLHKTDGVNFILVPFLDVTCFTITFWLAVYWRKKPEFHRRLVLIASCALTAAAFGRFPARVLSPDLFYAGVDSLILLGVVRDLVVNRRVHKVYLYALPAFIVFQLGVMYTIATNAAWWVRISNSIVG